MRLLELWTILEGKEQYVINNFGDRLLQAYEADPTTAKEEIDAPRIVEILAGFDPTKNNKYLVWIAKLYADRKLKSEDLFKLPSELELFARVQNKLEIKDIMRYPDLPALSKAVMKYENEEDQQSNKQQAKGKRQNFIDSGEAEVVYQSDTLKVVHPRTVEASCEFGKGTRWCTAATNDNYFHEYGDLYIMYPKNMDEEDAQDYPPPYQMEFATPWGLPNSDKKQVGAIHDSTDDSMELSTLVAILPEAKKFLAAQIKSGKLTPTDKEEYELILDKEFDKLGKRTHKRYYTTKLLDVIDHDPSKKKEAFIQGFKKAFTAQERKTLFNKNKTDIALSAFHGNTVEKGLRRMADFFGTQLPKTITEKEIVSDGSVISQENMSFYNRPKYTTRLKQFSKVLPKFNEENAIKLAAKQFKNLNLKQEDEQTTDNALYFIVDLWKVRKYRPMIEKAYGSKEHQQIFADYIVDPVQVESNHYGSSYRDVETPYSVIGELLLTDPILREYVKDELKVLMSKVKGKIKISGKHDRTLTQSAIRDAYSMFDDPRELRSVEPYEKSMQERGETLLDQGWSEQEEIPELQYMWYKLDDGAKALSSLGATKDSSVPASKMPNDNFNMTFMAAGKNSYILIFRARNKSWLLQVPYSGKLTGSGNPKVDGSQAKLYDAENTSMGSLQNDVNLIIDYIKANPQDVRDIEVDADQFSESKK